MSRGPGWVERKIADILDADPGNAFTVADLCERVYRRRKIEKKHRVAVLRAAANLMKRRDTLSWMQYEGLGGTLVYYTIGNVMSYAMARLKKDNLNYYRSNDERIYDWRKDTEADFRAMLAEGGKDYKYVVPGGVWWQHTQEEIAELEAKRSGDAELLAKVQADNATKSEARMAQWAERINEAFS